MPARLRRHAPYFPVADVARSAAHYVEALGFELEYQAGDPPVFAIVSRDGLAIMFRRVADPALIRPSEAQGGTWDAFCWVDDAEGLHRELLDRGAEVIYGPLVQSAYGMLELAVRDPDGHVLGFGQSLAG